MSFLHRCWCVVVLANGSTWSLWCAHELFVCPGDPAGGPLNTAGSQHRADVQELSGLMKGHFTTKDQEQEE